MPGQPELRGHSTPCEGFSAFVLPSSLSSSIYHQLRSIDGPRPELACPELAFEVVVGKPGGHIHLVSFCLFVLAVQDGTSPARRRRLRMCLKHGLARLAPSRGWWSPNLLQSCRHAVFGDDITSRSVVRPRMSSAER
jgi:hypothetical protein